MSTTSEEKWKRALTEILEELDGSQYNKMMFILSDIPKHVRTTKSREEMPQVIIEHYGVETSVLKIHEIMDRIPRRDPKVQGRLRPFVERLEKKQEDERRGEQKSCQPVGVKSSSSALKRSLRQTDPGTAEKSKKKMENRDASKTHKTDPVGTMKPKKKKTQNNDLSMKSAETTNAPESDCSEPSEAKLEEPANSDSSLNLNGATNEVQSAPVHTGRVKIKAVKSFNTRNTHLVVEVKKQLKECFVSTRLLAEALGYKMDEGVEARIREAVPISAKANMQGKKITAIEKV
ncbi:uncharacterized protein LOC118453813 [Neolamprologus brichardi]|uniref:uncharacterized protein LOC118453813 n=1 Tax=Neolamprologus brichardi TaxID=32507 RepID=UPI0016437B84|nr:uncharacterized protein LOC118453813 [Neolamprologus brichardi]